MASVIEAGDTRQRIPGVLSGDRTNTEFDTAVSWLLPAPIAWHGGRIEALQAPLHPDEAPLVRDAVERRVMEFTAGRACARQALRQLGVEQAPVRMGARRQPLWPEGITGSISHAAGFCVAAACTRDHMAGIGVDIESALPLPHTLVDLVCTPREKAWCQRHSDTAGLLAKFVFSAKEAVFKCLYPLFGEELEFEDVDLELDPHNGHFSARVAGRALDSDTDLGVHGRLACTRELVMTAAMLQYDDLEWLRRRHWAERADGFEGRFVCE